MRNTFATVMTSLAKERNDICLLSGDIGNRMFDEFKSVAPNRFINCGIAEANMMSMATGMGLCGLKPVVYTITPFTTTRCLEQIRTGAAYHESPVIIVGTGSGLSYAELGSTHHSLEDLAILRCIPNINVCCPCDSNELTAHLKDALTYEGPTYIRIGKKGEPDILNGQECKIGKSNLVREGNLNLLLCIGPIISEALKAATALEKQNIHVAVASVGTVKPLDSEFLQTMVAKGFKNWITLEEHHRAGGLGSSILEWLHDKDCLSKVNLHRMGIEDKFIYELGSQEYIRKKEEIDYNAIVQVLQSL